MISYKKNEIKLVVRFIIQVRNKKDCNLVKFNQNMPIRDSDSGAFSLSKIHLSDS